MLFGDLFKLYTRISDKVVGIVSDDQDLYFNVYKQNIDWTLK